MRAATVMDKAVLKVTDSQGNVVFSKNLMYVKPAEMISVSFDCGCAEKLNFVLEKR